MVGVLNFFVSVLLFYGMIIITYSVFESRKGKSIFLDAFWGLCAVFGLLLIKYLYKEVPWINALCFVGVVVVDFLMLYILRKGKVWEMILIILLNEASLFIGEMSTFLIFSRQIEELESWSFSNPVVYIIFTADGLFGVTIYYLISSIWKKFRNKRFYSIRRGLTFIFFPLSQIMLLYSLNTHFYRELSDINFSMIIGVLLCAVADLLLILSIYNQDQIEEARHKIEELNHAWDIEKEYYLDLAGKQKELAKIRHDMNAQFIVMRDMANKKDISGIGSMIDLLSSYIGATKENIYCGDSTINAVINEYDKICSEKSIETKYAFDVKEPLEIEPLAICSLLSNVMKNAIEASEGLTEDRNIKLNLGTKGGYFHLIEENTFDPKYTKTGHKGLGLEILKGIVDKHDGEMITKTEDNKFSIELSVKNINVKY